MSRLKIFTIALIILIPLGFYFYTQIFPSSPILDEVHQAKGNSEVSATFWRNDEFADYENYAYNVSPQFTPPCPILLC